MPFPTTSGSRRSSILLGHAQGGVISKAYSLNTIERTEPILQRNLVSELREGREVHPHHVRTQLCFREAGIGSGTRKAFKR